MQLTAYATGLALALTVFAPATSAQDAKVRVRVKADLNVKPDQEIGTARMVAGDAGSVVLLKTNGGRTVFGGVPQPELNWSLTAMDKAKLTVIKTDKPKIVWGEGPVALETIEYFADQFRLIASKPDPEGSKLLILQQVLNGRSLTGKAASIITELPYDALGKDAGYFTANMAVGFVTKPSVDGKHLFLGLSPATTVRAAGAPVWGMVLDKNMKPVWHRSLEMDPAVKSFELLNTHVDKAGAIWYFTRNVTDPAPKNKETVGHHFALYRLDSAEQKSWKLGLPGKHFPQQATAEMRADGSIVVAGTYSDPTPERNESIGAFMTNFLAAKGEWGPIKLHPYDKQEVKKVERFQNDMVIAKAAVRKDGGMFLVTMRSGVETVMVSDLSGKKSPKSQFVHGNMHIMHLDPAGEQKWYKQIERRLEHSTPNPGIPVVATTANMLFIFYNDAEANIEARKAKLPITTVANGKDLIQLEFKADGSDKGRVIMKEGMKQGYLDAVNVWMVDEGTLGTLGTPSFNKDRTFPVLVELGEETKK